MSTPSTTPATKEDIKACLEFLFSRQNLPMDTSLISKMNSELYIPVTQIVQSYVISHVTTDINAIIEAASTSDKVKLNPDRTMIRPNISPPQRTTLILHNIPQTVSNDVCLFL